MCNLRHEVCCGHLSPMKVQISSISKLFFKLKFYFKFWAFKNVYLQSVFKKYTRQPERFAWFTWAGLIRLWRGAWFAWAGLIGLGGLPNFPEQEWSGWETVPDSPEQDWSGGKGVPELHKQDWSGQEAGLIGLSRINQARKGCLLCCGGLIRLGIRAWNAWPGLIWQVRPTLPAWSLLSEVSNGTKRSKGYRE